MRLSCASKCITCDLARPVNNNIDMNIVYFFIVMMLLIESTIYAETSASVKLSIRLYPIQYINVNKSDTQSLALFNDNGTEFSQSHELSTYSTSQYTFKVDTVNSQVFNELRAISMLAPSKNKSIERESYIKKVVAETDINNLHLIYSMETL